MMECDMLRLSVTQTNSDVLRAITIKMNVVRASRGCIESTSVAGQRIFVAEMPRIRLKIHLLPGVQRLGLPRW